MMMRSRRLQWICLLCFIFLWNLGIRGSHGSDEEKKGCVVELETERLVIVNEYSSRCGATEMSPEQLLKTGEFYLQKKKNYLLARTCYLEACVEAQRFERANANEEGVTKSRLWKIDALRGLSETNKRFISIDSFSLIVPRWKEKKENFELEVSKIDEFLWKMDNFRIVADVTPLPSLHMYENYLPLKTQTSKEQPSPSREKADVPNPTSSASPSTPPVTSNPFLSSLLSKLKPYLAKKQSSSIAKILQAELEPLQPSQITEQLKSNLLASLDFAMQVTIPLVNSFSNATPRQFPSELHFISVTTTNCTEENSLDSLSPQLFAHCSAWSWFLGRYVSTYLGMDHGLPFYELAVDLILHPEASQQSLGPKMLNQYYLDKAICYEKLDETKKAIFTFQKVLKSEEETIIEYEAAWRLGNIYRRVGMVDESVNTFLRAKRNVEQRLPSTPGLDPLNCQYPPTDSREQLMVDIHLGLAATYKRWAKESEKLLKERRSEKNDDEIYQKERAAWYYYFQALLFDPISYRTLRAISGALTGAGGYAPHLLLLGGHEKKVKYLKKCWEKALECAVKTKQDIRQEASDIAPNMFLSPRLEKFISKSWSDFAEALFLGRKEGLELRKNNSAKIEVRRQDWLSENTRPLQGDNRRLKSFSSLFNQYSVPASALQKSLGLKPRLRVGYLVADYAKFATLLMRKLFYGGHNPINVEHVIISFCHPHELTRQPDDITPPGVWANLQKPSPFFTFLPFYGMVKTSENGTKKEALTGSDMAEVLNELDLDILIDVNINPLLEILCYHPAAIQISWMGRPFTSGSSNCIDYFIADPVVIEPLLPSPVPKVLTTEYLRSPEVSSRLEEAYTEKLLVLPETLYITDFTTQDRVSSAPLRGDSNPEALELRKKLLKAQGLPPDPDLIILANFNQLWKIDCDTFETWANILERTPPNVVLWLLEFSLGADTNASMAVIRRFFNSRDRSLSSRIFFGEAIGGDPASIKKHLERSTLVDLFLDSFEYNMGGTAIALLWSGIPVITLPGKTLRSRMAASVLNALMLGEELVMKTRKEYEDRVVKLVTEPLDEETGNELRIIREFKLKGRVRSPTSTALFNTARFIRHLEKGLKLIHDGFLQGNKPDHYFVSPLE